jgi:hypothetical protein
LAQILKQFHTELHGERTRSIQEVCHSLMSLPMVVSDHKFVSINLTHDYSVIDHDNAATTATSNMTMIDAYAI